MNYWRNILRFLAAQQLFPALAAPEQEALIGGQAVFEGVMMRSPHAWGIAVRKPKAAESGPSELGEIIVHSEPLARPSDKHRWMAWPFVRGLVTLGQAMKLGFRASKFSLNVLVGALAPEKEKEEKAPEMGPWMTGITMLFSIAFFIFMYKFVPLAAAYGLKGHVPAMSNNGVFNLVDGLIRLAIFVVFIWGLSLMPDMHRLFEYHGAEHKTVFAYEAQRDIPSVQFTQGFSTYHPRCGTSFLMTIMLISIFVYAAVPVTTFWARFGIRILLLPVIASASYEMIRFSARHGKSLFALMTVPGLWLQRITTKQPSDDQVECAIKALDEAMILERQNGGELVIA
ncbi:MAG TPA: DUF1385 domain-containing protein [Verrucomicrobiae bacterium]|jgi:uncharacterized protein YqhQ|nr:DUF1385 domain-containing protein [Verrucomicrobiae bacterium]